MFVLFMDPNLREMRGKIDLVLNKYETRVSTLIFIKSLLYQDSAHYVASELTDVEIRSGIERRINNWTAGSDLDETEKKEIIDGCIPPIIEYRDKCR